MATPDLSAVDAVRLFAELGLSGIELVCQPGTPFSLEMPEPDLRAVEEAAKDCGLAVVTLTPYMWDINSADTEKARANIDGLKAAVELAARFGAGYVRAYGGRETEDRPGGWNRTVEALQEVAPVAGEHNVVLVVENHPGTMTVTGEATARLVDDVGSAHVACLLDPANVMYRSEEAWETTVKTQQGKIAYVHVKDYDVRDGERIACIVGEGIVPWKDILAELARTGYDGYLSFEYERKWHPDQLPEAREGLRRCIEYVRSLGVA